MKALSQWHNATQVERRRSATEAATIQYNAMPPTSPAEDLQNAFYDKYFAALAADGNQHFADYERTLRASLRTLNNNHKLLLSLRGGGDGAYGRYLRYDLHLDRVMDQLGPEDSRIPKDESRCISFANRGDLSEKIRKHGQEAGVIGVCASEETLDDPEDGLYNTLRSLPNGRMKLYIEAFG
jgi:hypothetical protein